jgi:hypothetical protein
MHGNYHSACLSRSYRHMPIYKHSKLQRMEITTPRAFLGLIGICPFTNTPSYSTWKLPLACLSRSYRHMPIYKHSKLQCMEITTLHAFLGLIGICPFTNTPSYSCMEITTPRAFLGLIGICPFTNTPSYMEITTRLSSMEIQVQTLHICLSRSYRHMPIYKHSKLLCMEITTPRAFLGLIDICPLTNTPSYNAWKLPLRVPF